MVPPILEIFFCSSIMEMTGALVFSDISVECASPKFNTLRANSMTAHCIPKQIPKKGMLFSRACRTASIFPSIPRDPNPGATRIPSKPASSVPMLEGVNSSE